MDQRVGYHIGVVGHLIQNLYNEKLSEYGLTSAQAKVIYILASHGDQQQAELQKRLFIKAPTMNGIVESMLKKQLIRKEEHETDRRSKTIILTEKGRELDERLWIELGKVEEVLTNGLSEEEQKILIIWLKKVAKNIQS